MGSPNCIVVLGPTASGKTRLACRLAFALNGEVISLDSRQVYKDLDIGSGKDLNEYEINGKSIPYHLINVAEAGTQFYLHDFMRELEKAFRLVLKRGHLPVLCGGTGLYLDALRKDFSFTAVPEDLHLRAGLEGQSKTELEEVLNTFPIEHTFHVDRKSKKRLIRGIEVAAYRRSHDLPSWDPKSLYKPYYIGLKTENTLHRIRERLLKRMDAGLVEEAEQLLSKGLSHDRLQQLGLEYKFLSLYLQNNINRQELLEQLEKAIHQYARRQMTWFRKMEKEGVKIHWIKPEDKIDALLEKLKILL
ncbi:MAG TPA: tRNA (adenosine(37)-N6)-dimethylallyltransferase MiaA [Bacteroidia bacterium]|nr:tRNA (adenosine(37)-N6)-dimethylallyltransferase MiaA [Bacteroidia bacterium]